MIKKIAILGFGREGQSVFKFLQGSPVYKNAEIWILDRDANIEKFNFKKLTSSKLKNQTPLKFQTGKNYLNSLERFDIVYRSPGVPYNLSEIQKAIKKGVKFSSGTHLFFENRKGLIIGVAGTKGKGTTSTLLYKILKAYKKQCQNVFLAGNIGTPMLDILPKLNKKSISILELSSFQMQDLKKSPDIAVVLEFFPDHLDVHKNFKEYIEAEGVITKYQTPKDIVFYFSENNYSKKIAEKSKAKKISVNHKKPKNSFLSEEDFEKIKKIIKIPGEHNFKNAIMAASVASFLKAPKEIIFKVISSFKGNKHRLEFTKNIRINRPNQRKLAFIKFYNDSASTIPQTTVAAIRAFKEPKILIAGGKDKNLNYSSLAQALKNSNTKFVILFGENKAKIKHQLLRIKNHELRIREVGDLETAVKVAYKKARSLIHNSNTTIHILFSPASTSFDMFRDYAERGEKFKEIVKKLKEN